MRAPIPVSWRLHGLILAGLLVTGVADAVTLQAPRMVLNRSLFLAWNQASASNFLSYEVFASTAPGFEPSAANRVLTLADPELHYARVYGLSPSTEYHFVVRYNAATGSLTSAEVSATTLADGVNETRIPTVMYHHVQPRNQFPSGYDPGGWISTENFSRDMAYLKAHGVNPVGHEEILNRINSGIPLPPNPVFLTFDDGFVTYLQHAMPILLSNDFHSVNAIVTSKTGGNSDWAVPEWPLMPLMTWTQIKQCQRQGMWMGAHTQTHVDLNLEPNKAYEITGSRNALINQLKVHPRYFCYPWGMGGKRNQSILDQVAAAGFTLATRTWPPEVARVTSEKVWFPRVFANENDNLRAFLVKLDIDTDKDGLKNFIELDWNLDAANPDMDGDGLSDRDEVAYDGNASAYNPYHPVSRLAGTDLDASRSDTDLDGLDDGDEVLVYFTNPLRADTDGDGLTDGDEVNVHGSNPKLVDSDFDGMTDAFEVANSLDPNVNNGRLPYGGLVAAATACIEAENFDLGGPGLAYADTTPTNLGGAYRRHEFVDLATDASASNGIVMGWAVAGEWTSYTVDFGTGGYMRAVARVAASGTGGGFTIAVDGTNITGLLQVPNTGGWSAWQQVTSALFEAPTGIHVVHLNLVTNGPGGFVGNFDRICFIPQPPPLPQSPFATNGQPAVIPGIVQAEDFDLGGAGTAYEDATPANEGGYYRVGEAVDISYLAGASNQAVVGWTKPGEWLEYTVLVTTSGAYDVEASVASSGAGGAFRLELDGEDLAGSWSVPDTGSWSTYTRIRREGIDLSVGIHTLRVVMVSGGTSGNIGNFDYLAFTRVVPPMQLPYNLTFTPWPATSWIEAEDYDHGGTNLAYSDTEAANLGGAYRPAEGVDVYAATSRSNGHAVGWMKAGEWMEYTIDVPSNATYALEMRVANTTAGGKARIAMLDHGPAFTVTVPATGGWDTFAVAGREGLPLDAGVYTVRIAAISNAASGYLGNFDQWRLVARGGYPALAGFAESELEGPVMSWGPMSNNVRVLFSPDITSGAWTPVSGWMTSGTYAVGSGATNPVGFYRFEHAVPD